MGWGGLLSQVHEASGLKQSPPSPAPTPGLGIKALVSWPPWGGKDAGDQRGRGPAKLG